MRKFLFIIVILLSTPSLFAQENVVLVEPTPEAYVQTINAYLDNSESYDRELHGTLIRIIPYEFQLRGWDVSELSYESIETLYWTILENSWHYQASELYGTVDDAQWLIFQAYLRENAIELDSIETLETDEYTANIQRIDFNGDGIDELLLEVDWNQKSYHAFWILHQTADGYEKVQTPAPWFSETCNFREVCGGDGLIYHVGDVNADGLPELVIAAGSYCGYGECGGHLVIMAWRDGRMVSIVEREQAWDLGWTGVSGGGRSPILPSDDLWTFTNVDNDAPMELIQHRVFDDNRGCTVTNDRTFDWHESEGAYVSGEVTDTYADTGSCALREGQLAMFAADYDKAADAYRRAVELLANSEVEEDLDAMVYAQSERIIALVLARRENEAISEIELLRNMQPILDFANVMQQTVRDYDSNQPPIVLCSQVADALTEAAGTDGFVYFYPNYAALDNVPARTRNYIGSTYGATESGCDPARYVRHLLEDEPIKTDATPQEQLETLGIPIAEAVAFDINMDDVQDWIVRSPYVQMNIFLVSNGATYNFDITRANPFGEATEFEVQELPDNAGMVLVISGFYNPDATCYTEGSIHTYDTIPGILSLYQLKDDNTLSWLPSFMLCEPLSIDDINVTSGEISAWEYTSEGYVPQVWTWNSESQSFELPPEGSSEDATVNPFSCGNSKAEFCGFYETDPQSTLDAIDSVLVNMDGSEEYTASFLHSLTYFRALAFEHLNRPEEALAEYIALSEAYPDSLWGQLANLHLGAGATGG